MHVSTREVKVWSSGGGRAGEMEVAFEVRLWKVQVR